jgi:hypothetical protein
MKKMSSQAHAARLRGSHGAPGRGRSLGRGNCYDRSRRIGWKAMRAAPGVDQKPNNFGFAQIDLALKAKLPKYA